MKGIFSLTKGERTVLAFTFSYIIAGIFYCLYVGNTEFLIYLCIVVFGVTVLLAHILRYLEPPLWAVWGISLFGLLHVIGGLHINGGSLYDFVPLPLMNNGPDGLTFIRYDQIIHTFGSGLAALYAYYYLKHLPLSKGWLMIFAALTAMGLGSINEVIEFTAKLSLVHTDVGGYYNNSLDLVFNMLGAVVASVAAVKIWGTRSLSPE